MQYVFRLILSQDMKYSYSIFLPYPFPHFSSSFIFICVFMDIKIEKRVGMHILCILCTYVCTWRYSQLYSRVNGEFSIEIDDVKYSQYLHTLRPNRQQPTTKIEWKKYEQFTKLDSHYSSLHMGDPFTHSLM